MKKVACDLRNVLTPTTPLGPVDQEKIDDACADDLIDDQLGPFREMSMSPHLLLLGRKGAGKSAALAEIRIAAARRGGGAPHASTVSRRGGQFVHVVRSWQQFHNIVMRVRGELHDDDLFADLIFPEVFKGMWKEALWNEIISYFYEYAHTDDVRTELQAVVDYVNAAYIPDLSPREAAKRLSAAARQSVSGFLQQHDAQLFFLFDSMENYPVRNQIFTKTLSGLFPAISDISNEEPRINITFCIPEEIEPFMSAGSANLMKDFASSFRIRWRPIDLIHLVAHRLRASAKYYDPPLYDQASALDFSSREDLHKLFTLVLPETITNSYGHEENAWAYVIRHTQLLPRQVLWIFNVAFSEQYRQSRGFRQMKEDILRRAVTESQRFLATQILLPYQKLYPKLVTESRKILPDLEPICDYQSLRKTESRFHRTIEEDVVSVWDTLFEMGVLGRATTKNGDLQVKKDGTARYCYGQFYYNADMGFGLATDSEYCFHPVFTRAFGIARRSSDHRVIYPANIDLENIYA